MIAIVIVGYNSQRHLEICFSSIKTAKGPKPLVIFVDNCSSDNSADWIQEHFPETIVIENSTNLGFAKANNVGIARAQELGADYIFLLNPDTALDPHCLAVLDEVANETTLLQPLILLDPKKKTDLINTTGGVLSILGFSYCSDYKKPADSAKKEKRPTGSGAAIWIPSAVIKNIGSLDDLFFMYHEDVDLTWRATLAGYTIETVPEAKVWHDYSFSRNSLKFFYAERNRLFFLLKNFSWKYLLLLAPLGLVTEIAICGYMLLQGQLGAKLKSYGSIIRHWPHLMKERGRVQRLRQKSDRELIHYLADHVQFSEVAVPLLQPYNGLVRFYWRLIRRIV